MNDLYDIYMISNQRSPASATNSHLLPARWTPAVLVLHQEVTGTHLALFALEKVLNLIRIVIRPLETQSPLL
jgi:hypothetical protein